MKRNKEQSALKSLLNGFVLTQKIAIKNWEYYRLAVGIARFRKKGYNIITTMIESSDGVKYGQYHLEIGK